MARRLLAFSLLVYDLHLQRSLGAWTLYLLLAQAALQTPLHLPSLYLLLKCSEF